MSFAVINSGIDLRDFPVPEPIPTTDMNWVFWGFGLTLFLIMMVWLIYRLKKQSSAIIDPLETALNNVSDNSISTRVRFQSMYTALRGYLANQINTSWNSLTAEELTSSWKDVDHLSEVESVNLQEQWIQIESQAYGHDEITETQLESVTTFARNLVSATKRKNEK
ncbi:MAG: hypothetical protein JNJ77_14620 [Planctomycetia bacterium]|nr:hypothetical protein [Planctomycetia bacterium]